MSDENPLRDRYKRKRELENELAQLTAEIVPETLENLGKVAAHIPDFGAPDALTIAGSLLHAARCADEIGVRLRRALGRKVANADASGGDDPCRLLLVLWREPRAQDVQKLQDLGLTFVSPEGRWRPCTVFIGTAAPEALAEFVLSYGGDAHALLREKKVRGVKSDAARS